MTIEEKITAITEKLAMLDVQKVYDAAYAKFMKESVAKSFKVIAWGTELYTYGFISGTTWREWLKSANNTGGWYINNWGNGDIVYTGASSLYLKDSTVPIDDLIVENATYTIG